MILEPPPPPQNRYGLPLKFLVGSVVLFLLSLGLCGVGAGSHGDAQSFLVGSGLIALIASGIIFVGSLIWLFIAAITSRS